MRPALLLTLLLVACGAAPMDRAKGRGKTIKNVGLSDVPVRGFQAHVEAWDDLERDGELLAANPDAIWLLDTNGRTVEIHAKKIEKLELVLGTPDTEKVAAWSAQDDADVREKDYPKLFQFARFPQGLPPGWPVHERDGAPLPATSPPGG